MGFDTSVYYYFLYAVVCLFWFWRPSASLLLGASLLFYTGFDWRHLFVLVPMSLLTWWGGIHSPRRISWLLGAIFSPLVLYKLLELKGFSLPPPLGLSFFTFHCASYLIDCRRGSVRAEPSLNRVFLYVAFFPQLVAGPITRASEILPQFSKLQRPKAPEAKRAVWRIYLGLLKKFAIANVVGVWAKEVFSQPEIYHGYVVILAVIFGRYFIYADFSGYTDIAIGSARLLGVKLPENFHRPFAATSIADYWRRWHITLSAWIRDYVFFPLATSPLSARGSYPLVLLTFLLLGAWHGLSWNFLLYGLWHGFFLVIHDATRSQRLKLWRLLRMETGLVPNWIFTWCTFLFLVCPPTILFLSHSPAGALEVVHGLAQTAGRTFVKGVRWHHLVTAELSILFVELFQWFSERYDCFERFEKFPRLARWGAILAALGWFAFSAELSADLSFLYFQF